MEFRLLGPFEGPVELPGGKPRALLARLLLDAGRIVAVDALIEGLWERPPPSATKVLQAHISALRKVLGPETIETRRPGYALRETTSDLARFEALTERASRTRDAAERARLLREGLELWRGEPLAEFSREPFATAGALRLAELRLDALTARLTAELELGDGARVLRELTDLAQAEPLREEPRRLLMLALYRSGRQADALAVYRDGRRALVDALGLEPGTRLQELERAILRQDPSLAPGPVQPSRGPIVCIGTAPVALLEPLGRELIAVELVASGTELAGASERMAGIAGARTAVFTSADPIADTLRLATQQGAELLVVTAAAEALLAAAPCDVAIVNGREELGDGPVLVPFGGERSEWPALELGSWLAEAHGRPLRLLGAEAGAGQRDASRTLAAASLVLQRFGRRAAQTAVVRPGAEAVLAERGAAIVAAHARDQTRTQLLAEAEIPVLLVHGGLRPSGLAPDRTLTRFSWSLGE